jgi:hypothetical protein
VGREERDSVLLEVSLVGVQHTVEPLEELVSTVIGVENDGDTVEGSDGSNEVSGSDGSSDGSALVLVVDTLSGEESGSSLRALEDDGGVDGSGSLEDGVNSRRRGDVDGRDGVSVLLSVLEKSSGLISGKDTSGDDGKSSRHSFR